MQKNNFNDKNQSKDSIETNIKNRSYKTYKLTKIVTNETKENNNIESSAKKMGFIESYFFYPTIWHKILAFTLLPFSCIYALITIYKKRFTKKMIFDIKIISIGNLVSGGSGKTPFCITLTKYLQTKEYTDIYVVLRGYKRKSKGLIHVSNNGKILCNVAQSGDEAMLIATQTKANVIVSESRIKALEYIQKKDSKQRIVILDDAYRFNLNKFDILLEPTLKPYFPFVLPSGYYRFPKSFYKKCDIHLKEDRDYKRSVSLLHLKDSSIKSRYILATAIANPSRLKPYLPNNIVYEYYLADHGEFDCNTLKTLLEKYDATHILMTQKDYVKCNDFNLPFALLILDIQIESRALKHIESFLTK